VWTPSFYIMLPRPYFNRYCYFGLIHYGYTLVSVHYIVTFFIMFSSQSAMHLAQSLVMAHAPGYYTFIPHLYFNSCLCVYFSLVVQFCQCTCVLFIFSCVSPPRVLRHVSRSEHCTLFYPDFNNQYSISDYPDHAYVTMEVLRVLGPLFVV